MFVWFFVEMTELYDKLEDLIQLAIDIKSHCLWIPGYPLYKYRSKCREVDIWPLVRNQLSKFTGSLSKIWKFGRNYSWFFNGTIGKSIIFVRFTNSEYLCFYSDHYAFLVLLNKSFSNERLIRLKILQELAYSFLAKMWNW